MRHRQHRLLRIPMEYHGHIPAPELPISDLLNLSLPTIIQMDCVAKNTNIQVFSSSLPISVDKGVLHSVPELEVTQTLINMLGDALCDGMTSLSVPGINVPLPFWVLSFWEQMGKAIKVQQHWSRADAWVRKYATSIHPKAAVARNALQIFGTLPWDLPLTGFVAGLSICELAEFLSESLVNSNVVDAMMMSIAGEVKRIPELSRKVSVRDLTFSEVLHLPVERWQQYNSDRAFTKLRELGKALADGSLTQIIIPFNIANIHWALFLVDATAQQIRYGDSLGWSIPQDDVNRLNCWLHQHGFQSFKIGPLLPHGKQQDNYSCSVAMANIARHTLFGDPLFNNADKHFYRIQEFMNITLSKSAPSNRISEFADGSAGKCCVFLGPKECNRLPCALFHSTRKVDSGRRT